MEWTERGGRKIRAPTKRGFGIILIEKCLGGVGGSAQMDSSARDEALDFGSELLEALFAITELSANVKQCTVDGELCIRPAAQPRRQTFRERTCRISETLVAPIAIGISRKAAPVELPCD
jgi:hypothetical protein